MVANPSKDCGFESGQMLFFFLRQIKVLALVTRLQGNEKNSHLSMMCNDYPWIKTTVIFTVTELNFRECTEEMLNFPPKFI